jgi:sirohydrochlorin ferrochelatase
VVTENQPPETLPVRGRPTLPGGRHRRLASADLPPDAPTLVLATPSLNDQIATEIASLTRAAHAGIDIRVGHLNGAPDDVFTNDDAFNNSNDFNGAADDSAAALAQILRATAASRTAPGPTAVVVPLLTGPNPMIYGDIHAAVKAGGAHVSVTEPLGPHPLLAEALHVRLAESGLARADRIRQFSIGALVDGVVVVTVGGPQAVQEADITAVLLAARLAIPVVAASLDSAPSVTDAVERLRATGAARLALAPHVIGPEADLEHLRSLAAQVNAGCAAPLGTYQGIVRLVKLRYEVALEELIPVHSQAQEGTS